MLDKTYRPDQVEGDIYARWQEAEAFRCGRDPEARPYTIVIPPPNVTGSLHMGHALNNTLQDILIRLHRMRGFDTLWQPGSDHAGIATQMVVERQLAAEGKDRRDMGREAFIEKVWAWKEKSGGTINRQLRRLGCSCDWSRERFTMDEGLSHAVRKVFVDLYKEGLIYKDVRLVNWDTRLMTAISDLEVEQRPEKGTIWYFKYPIEGTENEYITVATTRPETMLGDTAVAVHPGDERYRDLVGRCAVLPLVGRRLVIVADEHAEPEQGSGAVKITPAHDFNDFEVGLRHGLERVNVLDAHGRLNENAPEAYRGKDRFVARQEIAAEMGRLGLVEKVEAHDYVVPYGDRSGSVIEPWLTEQWYVDAKVLAEKAIAAVESGRTKIVPAQWEKTYFEWMRNIQPWCISRQIWWGHQIPAWYGPDGEIFVETTEAAAEAAARTHFGSDVPLRRDEDVLDTWFSSALWPFSTLGWPEPTPELARYYPTDVLVTGFDIIFFWVARTMMMGLHFLDQIPFHTVYIHALVRDAAGQKMSKSKGNIIDPIDLIERYGADALRFTLAALAAQARDVKLAESRVEGYRNFATKLWNAARFCQMNDCVRPAGFDPDAVALPVNRWILGAARKTSAEVTAALDAYKFNEAANAIYHFTWGTFCDWYLELVKPALQGDDASAKAECRAMAAWTLERILHLLHPFMPFVTEALWERTDERAGLLALSAWPDDGDRPADAAAAAELDWVIRLIGAVRAVRAEMNVPVAARIGMLVSGANETGRRRLAAHGAVIRQLARLERIEFDAPVPEGAVQLVHDEATIVLPLAEVVNLAQERARLEKQREKLAGEIANLDATLDNRGFLANAPEHVVEEKRERLAEARAAASKLSEALARLSA